MDCFIKVQSSSKNTNSPRKSVKRRSSIVYVEEYDKINISQHSVVDIESSDEDANNESTSVFTSNSTAGDGAELKETIIPAMFRISDTKRSTAIPKAISETPAKKQLYRNPRNLPLIPAQLLTITEKSHTIPNLPDNIFLGNLMLKGMITVPSYVLNGSDIILTVIDPPTPNTKKQFRNPNSAVISPQIGDVLKDSGILLRFASLNSSSMQSSNSNLNRSSHLPKNTIKFSPIGRILGGAAVTAPLMILLFRGWIKVKGTIHFNLPKPTGVSTNMKNANNVDSTIPNTNDEVRLRSGEDVMLKVAVHLDRSKAFTSLQNVTRSINPTEAQNNGFEDEKDMLANRIGWMGLLDLIISQQKPEENPKQICSNILIDDTADGDEIDLTISQNEIEKPDVIKHCLSENIHTLPSEATIYLNGNNNNIDTNISPSISKDDNFLLLGRGGDAAFKLYSTSAKNINLSILAAKNDSSMESTNNDIKGNLSSEIADMENLAECKNSDEVNDDLLDSIATQTVNAATQGDISHIEATKQHPWTCLPLSSPSPQVFRSQLFDYQKKGLTWLLLRERPEIRRLLSAFELKNGRMQPISPDFELDNNNVNKEDCGNENSIIAPWSDSDPFEADFIEIFLPVSSSCPNNTCVSPSPRISIFLNTITGTLQLHEPLTTSSSACSSHALSSCRGGLLSDAMGLGKTVQMLSLIACDMDAFTLLFDQRVACVPANPLSLPDKPQWTEEDLSGHVCAFEDGEPVNKRLETLLEFDGLPLFDEYFEIANPAAKELNAALFRTLASKTFPLNHASQHTPSPAVGTLLVAPLSLAKQWESEAKKHFTPEFEPKIVFYSGDNRNLLESAIQSANLVITSYGTVLSEAPKILMMSNAHNTNSVSKSKELLSPLFSTLWRRVILDEAHTIKNPCARISKAVLGLRSRTRWVLTGTPIQNSLNDLFSQFRFLRVLPWGSQVTWNCSIAQPLEMISNMQNSSEAAEMRAQVAARVQKALSSIMLRRSLKSPFVAIVKDSMMGNKFERTQYVKMTASEKDIYERLFSESSVMFSSLLENGRVKESYTQVLSLLLRLRQAVCHPSLIYEAMKKNLHDATVERELRDIVYSPVCDDKSKRKRLMSDGTYIKEDTAHLDTKMNSIFNLVEKCKEVDSFVDPNNNSTIWMSSKLNALLQIIDSETALGHSIVVFSQWVPFLQLAAHAANSLHKIECGLFDGKLNLQKRTDLLEWFRSRALKASTASTASDRSISSKGVVLFISLRAGGTGLNLVEASRCVMIDPWWNPSVEDQAIQRVFRIGQTKNVEIIRLITEGSVEKRIVELHAKKRRESNSIMEAADDEMTGGDAVEGESGGGKLSLEDLLQLFKPFNSTLVEENIDN